MLFSAVLDFAGAVPRSDEEPAAPGLRELLVALGAIILVIPYRHIRREPWRILVQIGVVATVLATTLIALQGAAGYIRGGKSWHILPVVVMFFGIAAGNAVAFHVITRREPAG